MENSNTPHTKRRWTLLLLCALLSITATAQPWVSHPSRPASFTQGLEGRHIAVWASHGRYYDQKKAAWQWQRPYLFGTTEDLFSQTFALPYVIPMLERAGAVVWSPRERDWQTREAIVDNDQSTTRYTESGRWRTPKNVTGFALQGGNYHDLENPFLAGTVRMAKTTRKAKKAATATYLPDISEDGLYAVYVSYQTLKKSTAQAQYIIVHEGVETRVDVNQQMGGGTWVYLGTYRFTAGEPARNFVALSTLSDDKGVVTTDAVRLGGGMGNIERGGTVSSLPRFAEGARYWAQWAGAPATSVSHSGGTNDYNDDINCRSMMENWIAGGSRVLPDSTGLGVPIDLSLALHTDAGIKKDSSCYATLTICTTDNDGRTTLGDGRSRTLSRELAEQMVSQIRTDIEQTYSVSWPDRGVWDKNYSETRRPEVPAIIVEMLSHQSFPDMRLGHDPNFKFTVGRAIYKTVARYLAAQDGRTAVIAPLAPTHFRLGLQNDQLLLDWQPATDPLEPTAASRAYILYSKTGNDGFDNGTLVNYTHAQLPLAADRLQSYQLTAVNDGGESFPTLTLSAARHAGATKTILVIDGFRRLSSPAVNVDEQRFDLDADAGVSYLRSAEWADRAGQVTAGNTFDYATDHAEAILSAGRYNVVSCSAEAVEQGYIKLSDYAAVDLILGLEQNDGHSLVPYKSFTPAMQQQLTDYARQGGRLLVSGSFVGSDMQQPSERQFLAAVLGTAWGGKESTAQAARANGMGTTFSLYTEPNEQHYAAPHPDILNPADGQNTDDFQSFDRQPADGDAPYAFAILQYADGHIAAVANDAPTHKAITLGFPWECIKEKATRQSLMRAFLSFLLNE